MVLEVDEPVNEVAIVSVFAISVASELPNAESRNFDVFVPLVEIFSVWNSEGLPSWVRASIAA